MEKGMKIAVGVLIVIGILLLLKGCSHNANNGVWVGLGVGAGAGVGSVDSGTVSDQGSHDFVASYMATKIIHGRKEWLYRAGGRIYQMDVPQEKGTDRIRVLSNGQVVWVRYPN